MSSTISMSRSFPDIRFGLLVGTGGAVPDNRHDIRLRGIVVSQPSGSTGGVIQYDLFKARAGGVHERKDFLDSPPEVLLHALSSLQARHELEPSREMEERKPFMFESRRNKSIYKYPGQSKDRLFLPGYVHVEGPGCSGCTSGQEVKGV
ncbi:hypothetical protein SLS58_008611 [Diplodia intermedia]|uniref:Uncharacterized protein n=1 Tax=Diplodia intermedia TaxID=856260 RepID=A0ABR3TH66_9PEZI